MARIILVTGGSRSGKSGFAQRLAEELAENKLFVATCPVTDPEMAQRIARHQRERRNRGWQTVEEPLALAEVLRRHDGCGVVLIDCLTLWINNLMYEAEKKALCLTEEIIEQQTAILLRSCHQHQGEIILVTGEVGLGVVPENRAARLFRDLVGRCNQCVAAEATAVYLVSCGIPLQIKGTNHVISAPKGSTELPGNNIS